MNGLLSSVSSQFQRAIMEAMNGRVLPQIQATLGSRQGQMPDRGLEVPGRRPESRSEEVLNCKFRSSSRDELPRDFNRNEDLENTHYTEFFLYLARNWIGVSIKSLTNFWMFSN